MASFGEGIPLTDLYHLLTSIRSKISLQLDAKILDGPWEPISPLVIKNMILAINTGKIRDGQEIQLRLHSNSKAV
jgi:hypothetical protein